MKDFLIICQVLFMCIQSAIYEIWEYVFHHDRWVCLKKNWSMMSEEEYYQQYGKSIEDYDIDNEDS